MLYLGHFSFLDNQDIDAEPGHGYFTTLVEATDVEAALDQFKALILKLNENEDLFDGVDEIMLDSCIEVLGTLPAEGILAHYQQWDGEPSETISTALPDVREDIAVAYIDEADEEGKDENGQPVEPFVVF
jgi:hypothetical protein